mgnify:CR=1 FL=1
MAFGFKVEVWGDYACFTQPELKVERMTYDVPTPSAMRGLLESIGWHPGIRYIIDRVHVLNEIRYTSVRRNELKSKALASSMRSAVNGKGPLPHIDRAADIQQRASVVLTDVHYVIECHFELTPAANETDNAGKFCDILRRRLRKGQCYSQPYLGTREFAANFGEWPEGQEIRGYYSDAGERDLGLMLYDMDYRNPENIVPMFFRAKMVNGVIDVAGSEVYR